MDFLKNEAEQYMGGQSGGQQQGGMQGGQQQGGIQGDLQSLAGAFSQAQADPNMDENNPDHVVQAAGGQQQASGMVSSLLSAFKQQTGSSYTGNPMEDEILSKVAQQVTGTSIPPSVLGMLAKNLM